ncbi:MAG: gliding motility protein GldN [Bacteroidales bacterium]|jgi:gliding motility associated protien GldN|nr:gliding motility protein GldN [Bacteroidales bacterium]
MKNIILSILAFLLLLSFDSTAQIIDDAPMDGLFAAEDLANKEPIPNPTIRRADVMWSKRIWREIDFRQKFNQKFYFPIDPQQNWKSFITIVLDGLKEGELTAYDISNTDELLVPLTYNEILARETFEDHRVMRRPYPPYEEFDTIIYTEFDETKVMRLRIKEDWYFDRQRSQMMVRIQALCPVMIKERNGEEITLPLFWVSYQEARNLFANSLVFNDYNAAMRLSYDELFWKRLFDSYIYKEQNVYDRRISQYATGVDALLEAERIKVEMQRYEEDLWEY